MSRQNRGEVWLVDLGMVAKVRPCLVISTPALARDRALVTVVTHTTGTRGSRFEIPIKTRFLDTGVFDAQSLVTVSEAKFLRKLWNLQPDQLSEVEDAVRQWLEL